MTPARTGWALGPIGDAFRAVVQRLILFPLLRLVTPVQIRGRRWIVDLHPPVIVVANHVSHLDTPVILRALPGKIRRSLVVAAARDYFYRGRVRGTLLSLSLATMPFDRGAGSRESLAACVDLVRDGRSLLIFPEGTRSGSGVLGEVRRGAAVIAVETGASVLPIYVHGLADVMPKGRVAPLPGGVLVDVGRLVVTDGDVDHVRDRVEAELLRLADKAPAWRGASDEGQDQADT